MSDFNKIAIATIIKRLRKEKGLSQEVCSGLAGIARSHLAMIENTDKLPNFETLWKLAIAFNMKPHELVLLIENECEKLKTETQE